MRINRNVKSIKTASDHFSKHHYPFKTQYDFNTAIVSMDVSKNLFSITYHSSTSYDCDDDDGLFYQASDTEDFDLNFFTLLSIVSFHVGLVLPKEKRVVVRAIARNVIKSMQYSHAYSYTGWYGHSKDYSSYNMPIDKFINLVAAAVIPLNN